MARGKAAPVDELQVQGLSNPGLLRKVGHSLQFFLSASFNDSGTCAISSFNFLKLFFVSHLTTFGRDYVYTESLHILQVIITGASKVIHDAGRSWKPTSFVVEGDSVARMTSLTEGSTYLKSPSKSWKVLYNYVLQAKSFSC